MKHIFLNAKHLSSIISCIFFMCVVNIIIPGMIAFNHKEIYPIQKNAELMQRVFSELHLQNIFMQRKENDLSREFSKTFIFLCAINLFGNVIRRVLPVTFLQIILFPGRNSGKVSRLPTYPRSSPDVSGDLSGLQRSLSDVSGGMSEKQGGLPDIVREMSMEVRVAPNVSGGLSDNQRGSSYVSGGDSLFNGGLSIFHRGLSMNRRGMTDVHSGMSADHRDASNVYRGAAEKPRGPSMYY